MPAPATYKYLSPELAERLRSLSVAVRRPVEGPRQGLHRSPHRGSSVEFADYRPYARGDPPNSIDWAVFARTDRHVIRRRHEETNLRGYILLDISESMAYRDGGRWSKIDYACQLAAGLMYLLVNQGDSAGLFLFNDAVRRRFDPVSTLDGLRPMLLALEQFAPSGRSRIETILHEVAEQIRARSLILLISDLLQNPEEIARGLRHFHHNGHEVMVWHVLDPSELELPFEGLVELNELETGERLMIQAEEIKGAYREELQRYLDALRRGCADSQADYRLAATQQAIEQALARYGIA